MVFSDLLETPQTLPTGISKAGIQSRQFYYFKIAQRNEKVFVTNSGYLRKNFQRAFRLTKRLF